MSTLNGLIREKRGNFLSWKMAVVFNIVLAIALLGSNWLYAALARPNPAIEGRAGELLYAAAFDGFLDEWELYDGQQSAKIVNGEMALLVSATQTATWTAARHHFGDFDVSAQATAIQGPIDNAFGLIFRAQGSDNDGCDLPAIILCGIEDLLPLAGAAMRQLLESPKNNGYFAFLISSDGYYSLWKTVADSTKLLSAWIPSSEINQGLGLANSLRIIGQGSRFHFFINDTQVMLCIPDDPMAASTYAGGECIDGEMREELQDQSFAIGKLGFIAQSTAMGGGGVLAHFDDMIVFSPIASKTEDARL